MWIYIPAIIYDLWLIILKLGLNFLLTINLLLNAIKKEYPKAPNTSTIKNQINLSRLYLNFV